MWSRMKDAYNVNRKLSGMHDGAFLQTELPMLKKNEKCESDDSAWRGCKNAFHKLFTTYPT